MDARIMEFCLEVDTYFQALNQYQKNAGKDYHIKMLKLGATIPVTCRRIMADIQKQPNHKKDNSIKTIDQMLPTKDLLQILFTDHKTRVQKLSRSAVNLIARCDQLGMPHGVLLKLEREGHIEPVPGTESKDLIHYQITGK